MSQNDTPASEQDRQAAIERVRKARAALAESMGIFSNKARTADDDARTQAAKKEFDDATAELVRIQGHANVDAPVTSQGVFSRKH